MSPLPKDPLGLNRRSTGVSECFRVGVPALRSLSEPGKNPPPGSKRTPTVTHKSEVFFPDLSHLVSKWGSFRTWGNSRPANVS